MIGFILAAGFGTRLKPLTDHIPKALVPICGIPLVSRVHDFLSSNGITSIGCNSHYKHEILRAYLEKNHSSVRLYHEENNIRGTGGALYFANDFLSTDDCFCVANVDIISTVDLKKITEEFLKSDSMAALIVAPAASGSVFFEKETKEYICARSQQNIEKINFSTAQSADFIGMALYRKEFLSIIDSNDFSIVPIWKRAQNRGMKVSVIEAGPVYWIDTGSPRALARIHFDFLDEKIKMPITSMVYADIRNKKAFPVVFQRSQQNQLGPYSWVESSELPPGILLEHTVVFPDAEIRQTNKIENALVTRFGVIHFET